MAKHEIEDLETFIIKARSVHGDKYDYSLSVYTKACNKVKVRCIQHDFIFEVTPNSHTSARHGCKLCAIDRIAEATSKPRQYYIDKATSAHDGKYDYSLVPDKVKSKDIIEIVCPEHGVFKQSLHDHTSGKVGCKLCAASNSSKRQMFSKEQYVEKAKQIHGDKYDYSITEYVGKSKYITYECKLHGVVTQRADHHLTTIGCTKCASLAKAEMFKFTTEEYIALAKKVHGDKYDYSLVDYKNQHTKIDIICRDHGVFSQAPNSHLYAAGCPRCSNQRVGYRSTMGGTFYLLKVTDDVLKFGITNNLDKRLKQIQQKCKYPVSVIYYLENPDGYVIRKLESEIISSGIERGIITKQEMGSGYTETFHRKDFSLVLDILLKYITPD